MNKYTKRIFFDTPDDAGGAASILGDVEEEVGGQEQQQQEVEKKDESAPPAFDAKALATEFGTVLRDTLGQQQQKQEPEKPLTPEEAKKLLNFFEIDDEFMKDFGDIEKQKAALEKYRDGVVKQVDTMMQMRLQQELAKVHEQYNPVVAAWQEQQRVASEERFNSKYSDLAKPELRPLLEAVSTSLTKSGVKYKNEGEAFEALAKGVEAVIQQTNPQFKLSGASAPSSNKQKSSSSLPTTSPGGGGGGGGSGKPTGGGGALSILGPVRG